ncbi:MAG TPA: hypothetical protein VGW80_04720 [Solirubrobacterales bacterium]|jgi:hypothetical protein|nr:hypothetical protein [Solirubrobacterales bacterium]
MNPVFGILIVVLTLQAIAFVIAFVARYWVLRTETFEMRGIDVERATELVAVYVEGVHDHRFGFPTGVFAVDADRTASGRVIAREINFKGSAGMGPVKFGLKLPILGALAGGALLADADDAAGCLVAWMAMSIGFGLGLAAAIVLTVPFAFLALVEVVLRWLMRGEILATIDKVPEEEDSVRVRFEMRGLSAFGIEHQLRRGMAPPRPAGVGPAPAPEYETLGAVGGLDRLNAIFATAISVGLILSVTAFIVIGNSQPNGSDAAVASYSYEEEEPYEESYEEPYEEEDYEEEPGYEEGGYERASTSRYATARKMYLRYWREIDVGNYAGAYNVYYHTFATQQGISEGEFIAAEKEYLPDIGLAHIRLERSSRNPTNPNELWLYAEIPIRDGAGEFAGECRLFTGDLRMFHAAGRWYYRPGEAFGRTPSFGAEGGGPQVLPSSSERCS